MDCFFIFICCTYSHHSPKRQTESAAHAVLSVCLWMGTCLKEEPSFFCCYGGFLLSKTMFIKYEKPASLS